MHNDPSLAEPLTDKEVFATHKGGKLNIESRKSLKTMRDLSLSYTPGVARVCRAIAEDPSLAQTYTGNGSTIAIVSDGSAVLGLGNIGAKASLPVMEGKAQLFQQFAGINAFPIVLDTQNSDEIVSIIKALAPSFGGINLEDIAAPRCFEIERRLIKELNIPVMHDDQHGTAIVIMAGLRNACKVTNRVLENQRVVISGAGAAGVACAEMLLNAGITDIVMLDSKGVISRERADLNPFKQDLAERTNPRRVTGGVSDALDNATVFIGLSRGHVTEDQLKLMHERPMLFSLANPTPEIEPELAQKYGYIVATGRSDLPNQINNVLAFPGIFRGALRCGATKITPEMKLAASEAIASLVKVPTVNEIVPSALDTRVAVAVSDAVQTAWKEHGTESL